MILILSAAPLFAQHEHPMPMPMPSPAPQPHPMQHGGMQQDPANELLMHQASGTSTNPGADQMAMSMVEVHQWMLMFHGTAFVNQVVQSGPRGGDRLFSTNWMMASAQRRVAGGQLLLRSMLSLEPLTVWKAGYPEFFQTGEGLVDHQHPHDLFMELAAEFAIDVGDRTVGYLYAAPVGDPALGPVAFPHRSSAMEIPQATLSHHLQDSTHIASSVLTIGARRSDFGLALSGFHGREPDENRWNIDRGAIDSWAVRGTWDPNPNWTAQLSTGHLRHPEANEPGNIQRTTASVTHFMTISNGDWSSSLIWGWNDKADHHTHGIVAETNIRFNMSNYVAGRFEIVDKDELSSGVLTIKAMTLGYTKDIYRTRDLLGAVGGNVTVYGVPSELKSGYGDRPFSAYAFVRVRTATGPARR